MWAEQGFVFNYRKEISGPIGKTKSGALELCELEHFLLLCVNWAAIVCGHVLTWAITYYDKGVTGNEMKSYST